jgi:hypothetical protein
MPDDLTPALTPEQWAAKRYEWNGTTKRQWESVNVGDDGAEVFVGGEYDFGGVKQPATRHALAALCLYGQTFGFTWEDVRLLRLSGSTAGPESSTASRLGSPRCSHPPHRGYSVVHYPDVAPVKYTAKSFTVPATGHRKDPCVHGWLDTKGRCAVWGHDLVERDWTKLEVERAPLQGPPKDHHDPPRRRRAMRAPPD